ncbi:hypothetical protein [Rhodococcus sp. NPDC057529]|uniref:hypothetical protein n=1 Tax=Rhodococcus sp. NPDC057529 TaxID=3346158 RepID=UPI00366B66FE
MIITVFSRTDVDVAEPDVLTQFKVDVAGLELHDVAHALDHVGAGTLEGGDHAWIRVDFIKRAVGPLAADPAWVTSFDAMVHYARSQAWISDDGARIRGHLDGLTRVSSGSDTARTDHPEQNTQPTGARDAVDGAIASPGYRVVIVGLGHHGVGIARLLPALGHQIVGGVDIGDKVGRPLSEIVGLPAGLDVTVTGSVHELLDALETPPDIAVLTASASADVVFEQARHFIRHGINVVTLHQDGLTPDPAWTGELHRLCTEHRASFLATGVQDIWWVQLPALVAAASQNIRKITFTHTVALDSLSDAVAREIGIGSTPEEFARVAAAAQAHPSVLGGPMREAARRIGATAAAVHETYEPQFSDTEVRWNGGTSVIAVGDAIGTRETVRFSTDRGIDFEGVIQVVPIAVDEAASALTITGQPDLHLEIQPFPGDDLTNTGLISRIPDVVEAAPGVLFSADLPPARHHFAAAPGAAPTPH